MGIPNPAEPNVAFVAVKSLHGRWVFPRRSRVLSANLADLVPSGAIVLDVGCGDGTIGRSMEQIKPTVRVRGIEVAPRSRCLVECTAFDGANIPFPDASVDVCLFVDVLHHTLDIAGLLREARRVTRRFVLIKDHLCQNRTDRAILSFMDWVGNRAYGVSLPYNYQSKAQWQRILSICELQAVNWYENLSLYPKPFDYVFGDGLHFVALCEKAQIY